MSAANPNNNYDSEEETHESFDPEEEIQINPIENEEVLPQVEVKSGEEDEDVIFASKAKLYRYRSDQWKERGIGKIKILRHKETLKIRGVLRQEKTLKCVLNIFIGENPLCELKKHLDSEKAFFFMGYDYSDEEPKIEKFVLRFENAEIAEKFKNAFIDAKVFNKNLKEGKELTFADVLNEGTEDGDDDNNNDNGIDYKHKAIFE